MQLGLGLGLTRIGGGSSLARLLFTANEPGFTFEPWDITTLFQDRAGTTPVTAAGQSVGYRRDKSGRGNHQVAVSDAKRGVYGWMPKTGRRNQLTYTEQFDNAAWTKDGATVTANAVTAPDGTLTADTVSTGISTGEHRIYQTAGSSAVHTHTIYAKAGTANFVSLSTGNATYYAVFNLSTGAVSSSVSCTSSIVSVGDGWYRLTVTGSVAMPSFFFVVNVGETAASAVPATGSTGTSKTVHLWGAQLELGSTATAYQRVASQYDITEAGVPTCYYVQADGVDDAYVTPTITPNTDKVQVFAGVRKLSDAATGVVLELSPSGDTNNGSFYFSVPSGVAGYDMNLGAGASGGQGRRATTYTAPINNVISLAVDRSLPTIADKIGFRVNAALPTLSSTGTTNVPTGNFLAYPLYIYARAGTSFPFNGLDFGHAVRFGPNLDAATIARVESLIARNTPGVTL